jgi:hypothetical protein
MAWLTMV